ncbi:uncharacterized protein LOC116287973 [Actinia tenebrosa]|uniref:Uncharacterized protein LOC116287973 n=1 Tax=Actinia tenebrosa TaxID=6105 RepID=A0A6P8H2C9_ACTTE|nr:uncharacterized protein LOC116287973 [Actinia tenebrosa]
MVHSFQLIVAAAFAVLLAQSQGQTQPTEDDLWQKINLLPVCFEAKGNKPGELTYLSSNVLVGAMKLVHQSGTIRCTANPAYDSKWGCNVPGSLNLLNVVVTDKHNNVVYPLQKYMSMNHAGGLWYNLPFIHTLYSKELVFTNYLDPFFFPQHSTLKIWYGEDLKDYYESDNFGRVCVDVYIHGL